MAQQLENSPVDKKKATHGEKDQGDYLLIGKEMSEKKRH